MRVLLVKPLINIVKGVRGDPVFDFPLGLMYLSSFIKMHGYRDVKIVHMGIERIGLDELAEEILAYNPDVVGISALTLESRGMFQVAKIVKQYRQDCLVIAGGPHPSGDPAGMLKDDNIDLVVCGEGELALLNILKAYETNGRYHTIENVYSRHGKEIIAPVKVGYHMDIDRLPFPDWDAIDMEKYAQFQPMTIYLHDGQKYASIFTSRGCPFQCIYCHNIFGKSFRAHSPHRVLEEIRILYDQYGITRFQILDDIFNFNRDRAVDILKQIISSGMKIKLYFPNGLRGDMLDRELIDLLIKAGAVYVSLAVETASPRLQKEIKKNISFDSLNEALEYISTKNIVVNGFFMIGFPTETFGDVMQTISYALFSKFDSAGFFLVHPFAGTGLARYLNETGRSIPSSVGDENVYCLVKNDLSVYSHFKNWQLKLIFCLTNLIFYANPFRIIKIMANVPNNKTMKRIVSQYFARIFQVW